jgi:hypothetical protein
MVVNALAIAMDIPITSAAEVSSINRRRSQSQRMPILRLSTSYLSKSVQAMDGNDTREGSEEVLRHGKDKPI